MRVGASVVVACCLSLLVACGVEQSDPSQIVDEKAEAIAQAAELGQSEQAVKSLGGGPIGSACSTDCQCELGTHCVGNICVGSVIAGPPPPLPLCYSDCQCDPGYYCSGSNGNWGQCSVFPTCSVAWSYSPVPSGSTVNFIISSANMPPSSYLKLYGTRNGVVDVNGTVYNLVSGTFPIPNSPGSSGVYARYVRMYSPTNRLLCQSNMATVTFQ